ncbi:MAG TPA: TetR/AcrR family transcriptional regulator [Actinomycetota bacterium]|nr:TetR/AcrR family transcriptional regulator [Actinomycetota bacterium]
MTAESVAHARRTRSRKGEGEKLREEIVDAAERLLIETNDEEAVSIRAVADAVGVTPPSIYLHFSDKNELLFAVCERHFARFDEVIEQAGSGADDPLGSLLLRGRAYVAFGLSHPEHYRIMFMRKPGETPDGWQDELLRRSSAFDHHVSAVTRVAEAGIIEGDPTVAAIVLWAGVHGITSLLISKPDFPWPDRDALIDAVLTAGLRGVAVPPTS